MAVTELALLTTTEPPSDTFHQAIDAATSIQDAWCLAHQDVIIPRSREGRCAVVLQQVEDPTVVLVSALWASPTEHWTWIGSQDNKDIMSSLLSYLAPDKPFTLFHLDAEIFTPGREEQRQEPASGDSVLDAPVISVGRMFVEASKKAAFETKFHEVREILQTFAAPRAVRWGWRIEKQDNEGDEDRQTEEFVLFCGWDDVARHMAFAKSEGFAKYGEIREFVRSADIKHYRRYL